MNLQISLWTYRGYAACLAFIFLQAMPGSPCIAQEIPSNLQRKNLVAWCLVPFDASKRDPQARAEMLNSLGLRRFAYDWRNEHVASWDDEIEQLRKHQIELTAFWCTSSLTPGEEPMNQKILELLKRHEIATQLWIMLPDRSLMEIPDEAERVATAARAIREFALLAAPLGCRIGLYNHGGWIGQPQSLVKVMRELADLDNVGIVYNFHHAHAELDQFPQALKSMKPYLLCINLNGTTLSGPKILPIGQGEFDSRILKWIDDVGFDGSIGILDHRPELDAQESLQENIQGLEKLLQSSE